LRVLLVSPEFPPFNIGGGGVVVKNLAQNLTRLGCDVTVVSGYYPVRSFFDKVKKTCSDFRVVWLPLLPTPSSSFQLKTVMPPNIFSFAYLIKMLRGDYDIIHFHGFGHLLLDVANLCCLILRKKFILTVHGFPRSPFESGRFLRLLYRFYLSSLGRILFKRAVRVIYISRSLVSEALSLGLYVRDFTIIPNGINVEEFNVNFVSDDIKRKWGVSNDDFVLVAVGVLHARKGFQYLIKALSLVRKFYPRVKLFIIGADLGYGRTLRDLIRKLDLDDRVVLTGFLDSDSKKELMHIADIFVIPSVVEPFGLVGLEAMACGKPIIATKVGGLKEFLEDGKTALFVKPKDVKGLAEAIIRLIENEDLREFLSKNARQEVRRYDWSVISKRYFDLYSALMNERGI